jgi:hypothetical protein
MLLLLLHTSSEIMEVTKRESRAEPKKISATHNGAKTLLMQLFLNF